MKRKFGFLFIERKVSTRAMVPFCIIKYFSAFKCQFVCMPVIKDVEIVPATFFLQVPRNDLRHA